MARVLSGVQPSGDPHVGNYLGAWMRWAREQEAEHLYCVVDLHAMTVRFDPGLLRERTLDTAAWLLACGLDPDVCTLFVQSHVREHTEAAWVLACVASMGELGRMTHFKEKSQANDFTSAALFTYPVLQAADILLYHAEEVPVGDDQRQHVELTRDVAQRFNHRFGDTFTLPMATVPKVGARIMDLQNTDAKMSKSLESAGTIRLEEEESATRRKIMRSITDSGSEVRAAADKPGVTNLLELFAAVTGAEVADLEARYAGTGYGDFKRDLAEAVNGALRPVRERHAELRRDPAELEAILAKGADKARAVATSTMATIRERVGLLPSGA
ncbi:tryptophan--tRNA ligase [soil metagenome]